MDYFIFIEYYGYDGITIGLLPNGSFVIRHFEAVLILLGNDGEYYET